MRLKGHKILTLTAALALSAGLAAGCQKTAEQVPEGQTTESSSSLTGETEQTKEEETEGIALEIETGEATVPNELPDSVTTITDENLVYTSEKWGFSIQFPDESWYTEMSGDSSIESYSSEEGTVSIVHVDEADGEDFLPYLASKEQWEESLMHTGEQADFTVEGFQAEERDGIRTYRGEVSYADGYYQYGITIGYYQNDTKNRIYQVEILMRNKDEASVKAAKAMADSFQVLE